MNDTERNTIVLVPQNEEENIKCIEIRLKSPEHVFRDSDIVPESIYMGIEDKDNRINDIQDYNVEYDSYNTHCLICFDKIENQEEYLSNTGDENSFNIFKEENLSKSSKKSLLLILSEILQKDVKENVHSKYICFSCFKMLNDYDDFTVKLKTLTSVLRNTYFETCENLKSMQSQWNKRRKDVNILVGEDLFNIKLKRKKPRRKKEDINYGLETASNSSSDNQNDHSSSQFKSTDETLSSSGISGCSNNAENSSNSNNETASIESRKHNCDSCNFYTFSSEDMNKHKSTHFCSICGLFLTHPKQMRNHLIKVHNFSKQVVNQYKCNICDKKYSSNGSLHNHIKTIHGEASYTCNVCERSFKHARLLAIHEVRHREKNIKCSECNACFYFNANLNKHVNSVHRKVRAYQCPICLKYLCQRSALTHHMSQHTNAKNNLNSDSDNNSNINLGTSSTLYLNNDIKSIENIPLKTNIKKSNVPNLSNSKLMNILPKQTFLNINTQNVPNKVNKVNIKTKSTLSNERKQDDLPDLDIPVVSLNLDSSIDFGNKDEKDEVEINLNFDNSTVIPLMSTNVNTMNSVKHLEAPLDIMQPSWTSDQMRNVAVLTDGQESKKFVNLFVQDEMYDENFEVDFLI